MTRNKGIFVGGHTLDTSTAGAVTMVSSSTTSSKVINPSPDTYAVRAPRADAAKSEALEGAVYSYVQAVRALGRTTVNSLDIADALNLPTAKVEQALRSLSSKGVRATR